MNTIYSLPLCLLVLAAALWARHGLLARWRQARELARRTRREDALQHILAPVLAENVSIRPLPEFRAGDLVEKEFLSGLRPGGHTRVLGLSPACRGQERRRLLDLGFVPGTLVEVDMVSPAGDPTAYRVRGAVVALRREQANLIRVNSREATPA